ncbi:MAG: phosphoribosylformylglycinamidine synthase, partial [Clostridia bacterium]|nr:phosphoribosylformylglycinamidine synthase [Clostridia bacterium]
TPPRLFRNGEVTRLIKRCNDFGAGGVSVAIGELADGLMIDLDKVPKKYDGLDGTELAISESQERMAVVLAPESVDAFMQAAHDENLEATVVAKVTEEPRLRMTWKGNTIVDLSREFLNSNGAEKHTCAKVVDDGIQQPAYPGDTLKEQMENMVSDLNICSKKGLSERFDSTIGAGTVVMPFGGKTQLTPVQTMVAKIPLEKGETTTCSGMAYGFHPQVMEQSPYEGAYLSVVESIAKLVAAGFSRKDAYLTFQEYFQRMTSDPAVWGKPMAALLGALDAQLDLECAAIGGKDSMSGTFEDMHVPPTLVSFAVAPGKTGNVISPEFKQAGNKVVLIACDPFDTEKLIANLNTVEKLIAEKKAVSGWALGLGGVAEGLYKMGLGNKLGFKVYDSYTDDLFAWQFGGILLEVSEDVTEGVPVGEVLADYQFIARGETIDQEVLLPLFENKLEKVLPYRGNDGETVEKASFEAKSWPKPAIKTLRPMAFVPVFPGTNCEVDTLRALNRAGADGQLLIINNLTPADITASIDKAVEMIARSQMIVLPGGFSGGDEPDGSGKFITAFFRNPRMKDAVHELLKNRDGLMLGICNGFQALVKLGLVPFGEIVDTDDTCPTLTFNTIGRHQSMLVNTRIASNKSPWLSRTQVDEIHTVAISHGEGRFVAPESWLKKLAENGQIATQYVDLTGQPTLDLRYNPNASYLAIEGITSPDGRVLGKMGHTERSGDSLYKNVPGNKYQPLFEGGVDYFK